MEWLGDRSYTIYLLHFPVFILAWLAVYFGRPSLFGSPVGYGLAQMILAIALCLPLCELVYRFVELPCLDAGKKVCGALFAPRPVVAHALDSKPELRADEAATELTGPHVSYAHSPGQSVVKRSQ
jgi:peptidoglycan/LPS O-acetylase OafA/YrhL